MFAIGIVIPSYIFYKNISNKLDEIITYSLDEYIKSNKKIDYNLLETKLKNYHFLRWRLFKYHDKETLDEYLMMVSNSDNLIAFFTKSDFVSSYTKDELKKYKIKWNSDKKTYRVYTLVNHCFRCKELIYSDDKICDKCDAYICSNCGACFCKYNWY